MKTQHHRTQVLESIIPASVQRYQLTGDKSRARAELRRHLRSSRQQIFYLLTHHISHRLALPYRDVFASRDLDLVMRSRTPASTRTLQLQAQETLSRLLFSGIRGVMRELVRDLDEIIDAVEAAAHQWMDRGCNAGELGKLCIPRDEDLDELLDDLEDVGHRYIIGRCELIFAAPESPGATPIEMACTQVVRRVAELIYRAAGKCDPFRGMLV